MYVDLSTFVQSDQDLLISHAQMLAYKMHVRICNAPPVHGTVRKDYFQIWTPYASTIGVLKLNTFFVDIFFFFFFFFFYLKMLIVRQTAQNFTVEAIKVIKIKPRFKLGVISTCKL